MRVGVLGGGQLGRMLALAGHPLGCRFIFLDPAPDAPAAQVAEEVLAAYDDPEALDRLSDGADVITYEFENVPVESVRRLAERLDVHPPAAALDVAQDRLAEKRFFTGLGIATAAFEPVDAPRDIAAALERVGAPAILKTRRFGYDGKGQAAISHPDEADSAWEAVGRVPSILEARVPFDRELSVLAVRGRDGRVAAYPLIQNVHEGGILRTSRAPAEAPSDVHERAVGISRRIADALDYVGVLGIELFDVGGDLLANEMAPRVHNSGHWTIEGAETSQFENHLRAILGLPLGSTAARGHAAMVNLLGSLPDPASVLATPGAHLHLYGKSPRPGRKVGHVTARADSPAELEARLGRVLAAVGVAHRG